MPTPLLPQEIHLLERYSSKAYFDTMRDAWDQMLRHTEQCLEAFMRKLPLDYRSRPVHEQPDIVWGERVLPNLRSTMKALNDGYIRLTHGEMQALGIAGMVRSDFSGLARDYSSDWMDEPQVVASIEGGSQEFWRWLGVAIQHAANIDTTVGAYWVQGDLSYRYDPDSRGELDPPTMWDNYTLSTTCIVQTDEPVTRTGIYLPGADDSCAAFMIEGVDAPPASVGYDPDTMQNVSEEPSVWRLIERSSDGKIEDGISDLLATHDVSEVRRVQAGQACPHAGWWYTPARLDSRRLFSQGEIFPLIEGDYGDTFWIWARDQSRPRL